jgi:hypothetical protein
MGVLALTGAACLVWGIYSSWRTVTFRLHAQPITGTVLGKRWRTERMTSPSIRQTRYLIDYQFHAPGGEFVKGSDFVTASSWERAKAGDRLRVYYRPGDAHSNGLGVPLMNWDAIIFAPLWCLFVSIGIIGEYCIVKDLLSRRKAEPARHAKQFGEKRGKRGAP